MSRLINENARHLQIVDGNGCRLTDADGKTYLDFLGGWCVSSVGWKHHEVIQALKRQAERGFFPASWFRSDRAEAFARTITDIMPSKKLNRVFRCTSGSEAIDTAIQAARAATSQRSIVSLERMYHGHTYGAASIGTGLTKAISPGLPDIIKLPLPDEYHGIDTTNVMQRFEHLIRAHGDIAAFVSEPVFTSAGAVVPPRDFYPTLEHFCRQHGILIIMDEVATGFGRCGSLFASSLWGLRPDIICLGKGITGGYGTMGAVVVTEEIAQHSSAVPSVTTFGWNPYDLAAAESVVGYILRERLWENALKVGSYLLDKLRPLESRPYIGQVRGHGLALGIEIVKERDQKTPDPARAEKLMEDSQAAGLVVDMVNSSLFLSPPLTLTRAEADEGVKILETVAD